MPWCDACDRFLSPPTVRPEGTCPTCGGRVDTPPGGESAPAPGAEEELPPVPRHLKLLGVALAVYLGWRLIQGIVWLVGRF